MSKSNTFDEIKLMNLVHKKRKCAVCGSKVVPVLGSTFKGGRVVTHRRYKCESCKTVCYYSPGLMSGRRIRFIYGDEVTEMIEQGKVPEWMGE